MSLCQQCGSFTFHHKLCSACKQTNKVICPPIYKKSKRERHLDFKPKPYIHPDTSGAIKIISPKEKPEPISPKPENTPVDKRLFFNQSYIDKLRNNRKVQ